MHSLLLVAIVAAQPPVPVNPLAEADRGQRQCYQSDERRQTCRSIAAYRRIGDHAYINTATVLISPAGPITLETETPVVVRGAAVCGFIRMKDITAGKLRIGTRLLDSAEAAPILARVAQAMAPLVEKEICTNYRPSPDGLVAIPTIAGERRDADAQRVTWIASDAAYTIAP